MTEVWKTIRDECGKLSICTYKDTGCSDCLVNQTFNKIENALEKHIAKPVKELNDRKDLYVASCTVCGYLVYRNQRYCDGCGQKLDWSEV